LSAYYTAQVKLHISIFLKITKHIDSGCNIRSESCFNITLLVLAACNAGPLHFAVHFNSVAISAKDFVAELITDDISKVALNKCKNVKLSSEQASETYTVVRC
jgi:hypothetical protein